MKFMRACGADFEAMRTVEFYAAHEALAARLRAPADPHRLAHRRPLRHLRPLRLGGGAHPRPRRRAHRLRRLGAQPDRRQARPERRHRRRCCALIDKLDPEREPGRLTFITRMGAGTDPRRAAADRREGHGVRRDRSPGSATRCTATPTRRPTGYKTRDFDDVVEEVEGFFEVHRALGTRPGGIHVELTGDDVTECLGGVGEDHRRRPRPRYETACDPRLNHQQSPRAGVPRRRDARPS